MRERLVCTTLYAGEVGITLGALFAYKKVPISGTIVAIDVSPGADDAALTLDVNNVTAATELIAGIVCATKAAPGQWATPQFNGGTNTPAKVTAGDILSFDANNAAANTTLNVDIWILSGEL